MLTPPNVLEEGSSRPQIDSKVLKNIKTYNSFIVSSKFCFVVTLPNTKLNLRLKFHSCVKTETGTHVAAKIDHIHNVNKLKPMFLQIKKQETNIDYIFL